MSHRPSLLLLAFLAACSSGKAAVSGADGDITDGGAADPADDTGDVTGGDGAGGDGGGDGTDPATSAFQGSWSGDGGMEVREWDYVLCEGSGSIEIDAEGLATGGFLCEGEGGGGGGGGGFDLDVAFVGAVDEAGAVTGTVSYEVQMGGGGGGGGGTELIELDVSGEAADGQLQMRWTDEIPAGGGGETAQLDGWWELSAD